MKILIIGSCKEQESPEHNSYIKACQEIGAELVRRNHTLVVGSKNPKTADAHFLTGANGVTGAHRVIVVRGDDDREVPRQDDYKNLTFQYRRRGDNWSVARAFQLRESDGVIAVGGGSGTMQTGMTAPALEKPVLGISAFGGSGKELWNLCKSDYARVGLTDDELGDFENAPWSGNSAKAVVNAIEALVRRNPYQANFVPLFSSVLAGVLLLIILWVFLFVKFTPTAEVIATPAKSAPGDQFTYAIFALLGISTFLGAGMRTALPMLEGRIISLVQLLKEMTVGLFLAFGFVLIYLSAGILLLGEVALDAAHFRNAAVATSLMGFAVAFFAEQSAEKLRQQLSERL